MPRNSGGTYSAPPGQPVVSGSTIASNTHNSLVGDIAVELSNSLDRQGRGAMSAPLKLTDGVVGAPGVTFSSETNSGLYRAAANDIGLTVGGTRIQRWQPAGTSITGTCAVSGATTLSSTLAVTGNTTVGGTLGVTGNTTLAGTLGVTGASTLSAAAVTGNATVGGTLGVTGATTLGSTLAVAGNATFSGDASVNGAFGVNTGITWLGSSLTVVGATSLESNLLLTSAVQQDIIKGGGATLTIGTGAGNAQPLEFYVNGNKRAWFSTGGLDMESGAITRVATPSAATDAATKGYVDGLARWGSVSDAGALGAGGSTAGISVVRSGAGQYRISHASITANSTITVTGRGTLARFAHTQPPAAGYVDVEMWSLGSPVAYPGVVDSGFNFELRFA